MHGSEVSESKPLGRVHVPRVHARAACDHPIPNQNKKKQMPVCEVSESKPLGRVHVPRVHARAACDHPIPNQNEKNKANASV
jgi:hypothetical protein